MHWKITVTIGALTWLVGLPLAGAAQVGPTLRVHYQERAPYSQTDDQGNVSGLVATPVAQALARAGVPFVWVRTPSQRQLALIQDGTGPDCGIGWFRTPAREAAGQFTRAVYRDQPFAALMRADHPQRDPMSAQVALADPALPLLVKAGYSYGPQFDAWIAGAKTAPVSTAAENHQMLAMIGAARAAWMLIVPEEAQLLLAQPAEAQAPLRLLRLSDAPPGATRHIYCSPAVAPSVIAQINRALPGLR